MKKIIFIFIFFVSLSSINSYPIKPRPLMSLMKEAKIIVTGYVLNTYREKTGIFYNKYEKEQGVAQVEIREVLTGDLSVNDTIKIVYSIDLICPQPASFYDSTDVLLFLGKSESDNSYFSYAMSYGTKILTLKEIELYKKLMVEIRVIWELEDETKRKIETVEWLVKCMENPASRFEGLYEMKQDHLDFDEYALLLEEKKTMIEIEDPNNYRQMLTDEHRKRLKKALISTEKITHLEFNLIEVVEIKIDNELNEWLYCQLNKFHKEEYFYYIADDLFRMINTYHKDSVLNEKVNGFSDIDLVLFTNKGELINLISDFKNRLKELREN